MPVEAACVPLHRMTGAQFRSFQESRPDHERWELVKGTPMMMVPPTISHQRIADNLTRLLNDALTVHDPARLAVSASGVELGEEALAWIGEDYRPEPDVLVMDADYELRQRFVERAYVFAEIVSDSDNAPVPGEKEPWIAIKRRLYLAHPPCEAVILIDPYRVDIRTDLRMSRGWTSNRLTRLDDWLTIPTCGLRCPVSAVYDRTPLNRPQPGSSAAKHGNAG
jgi:Uma2 family endonuclease